MKAEIVSLVMMNQPKEAMMSVLASTRMEFFKPFLICCLTKKSESPIMEIIASGCIKDMFGSPKLYFFTTTKKTSSDIIIMQ